jgi:O-acetyl-ADP-ribose deacetylase (regulator of RNase III)
MKITEVKQDLFTVSKDYILVHCISADFAMGAGIAKEFTKRGVKDYLLNDLIVLTPERERVGECVVSFETGWVAEFNLITKEKYWHKPTYDTLRKSLLSAKEVIVSLDDRYGAMVKLAMPHIGCGLDRLSWTKVKAIIEEIFADTDIEILVCSI